MRSSPFELEVDAPAEPLSMVAHGAAELRWRRNAGAVMQGRARVRVRRLVASSLKLALRAPSDPAGLRRRAASAGAEPLSLRALAAVVLFPAVRWHAPPNSWTLDARRQ